MFEVCNVVLCLRRSCIVHVDPNTCRVPAKRPSSGHHVPRGRRVLWDGIDQGVCDVSIGMESIKVCATTRKEVNHVSAAIPVIQSAMRPDVAFPDPNRHLRTTPFVILAPKPTPKVGRGRGRGLT